MVAGTDPHLYDVDEIGELLAEIRLLAERDANTLATVEAAAERLTPAQRTNVGRLLGDLAAVAERHAVAVEST